MKTLRRIIKWISKSGNLTLFTTLIGCFGMITASFIKKQDVSKEDVIDRIEKLEIMRDSIKNVWGGYDSKSTFENIDYNKNEILRFFACISMVDITKKITITIKTIDNNQIYLSYNAFKRISDITNPIMLDLSKIDESKLPKEIIDIYNDETINEINKLLSVLEKLQREIELTINDDISDIINTYS